MAFPAQGLSDQHGVDPVSFAPSDPVVAQGSDLEGVEDHHLKATFLEPSSQRDPIRASGLDPDLQVLPCGYVARDEGKELLETGSSVFKRWQGGHRLAHSVDEGGRVLGLSYADP
jgi:hypothetical protein